MVSMLACSSILTQFRHFCRPFCSNLGSSYAHLWHPWTLLGTSRPSLGPSWGHLRSHHGHQAFILMPYCASLLPACFHMMPTCSTSALSRHPDFNFEGKPRRILMYGCFSNFASIHAHVGPLDPVWALMEPSWGPLDPPRAFLR